MDSKYLEEIKAKCSANTNGATLISNKALLSLTSKVETLKGENKSLIRKVGEYYKQYDTLKKALEKYQKAEQWLDDVNNPLEPIKVLAALNSEVMKLNYRREHKPESISELDGTIISALLFVQQAQEQEGKDNAK